MAKIEVTLPKMGESVAEATINTWVKSVGDTIEEEETLVEISTDKVDSEVPCPADGVVSEILVEEGEVAQVGQVIAIISTDGDDAAPAASNNSTPAAAPTTSEEPKAQATVAATPTAEVDFSNTDKFYSPLVKNIAKEEGISMNELESITGTGQNGRVTKSDILAYLEAGRPNQNGVATPAPETKAAPAPIKPAAKTAKVAPAKSYGSDVEVIEMDRMRKLISKHMIDSKQTSPHVTSFVEADVTNLVNWRNKIKKQFEKREGEKITFTPIFIEAIAKAIKDFPMINVSVDGDNIIRKKAINVGMAAALPSGNLIVPVIHNADNYNLIGLTKKVNDLARRAREKQAYSRRDFRRYIHCI